MPFRQISVAVAGISPWHEFAATRFLQSSTSCTLKDLSALVFGDHPLHLCKQLTLRRIAEGISQKNHLHIELLELLDEQPLMGIFARETVRFQNDDGIEFAALCATSQPIQCRTVEPRAAKTIIEELMLGQQTPPLLLHVLFEQLDLGGNRPLQFLIERRDSGVDCDLHLYPPGVRE